nr:hypothetical protein [Pandoravirus aubagnensis]
MEKNIGKKAKPHLLVCLGFFSKNKKESRITLWATPFRDKRERKETVRAHDQGGQKTPQIAVACQEALCCALIDRARDSIVPTSHRAGKKGDHADRDTTASGGATRPLFLFDVMQSDNNTTACADTTEREAPWKDVEIHYDQDTDIVDIYVVHVTPGLITRTIPLDNDETDVLMGMDDEGRTIAIKFLDASSVFARRFFTKTVVPDASSRCACPSFLFGKKSHPQSTGRSCVPPPQSGLPISACLHFARALSLSAG